jgi:hypothetical protein
MKLKTNPNYINFKFNNKNNKWYSYYNCSSCKNNILVEATKKYYLARNLKKKNICKKCSLKKQIGSGNPFFNKSHTSETKLKISKKRKGIRTSYHHSNPKYKKMWSKSKKKLWASGKMEDVRKKMSDLMKKRIANGDIKGYIRSKAEDEIILILNNMGVVCEPNYRLEGKIFDIYVPKFNLLIEYNGDYWHCNPKKYEETYWHKKKNKFAKEIWEYDKKKIYLAKKNNYICEIIWEYDYKKNPEIINKIINKYEQ